MQTTVVIYDNWSKRKAHIGNHASRPEVKQALEHGTGSTVERSSNTMKGYFFYSASYYPDDSLIVRSALHSRCTPARWR